MAQPIELSQIGLVKDLIFILMLIVTISSLHLSYQLTRLLKPLQDNLRQYHQKNFPQIHSELISRNRLEGIKQRYINLFNHVDDVDTHAFSAGEIESLSFRFLNRNCSAAAAHSWLRQAPALLISLGLLGTFAGLTVGLGQISGALATTKPEETIQSLQSIIAPMGTAFQTSLVGLLLSLLVLIISQVSGSRDVIDSCEALLSSWLETILPQQLGHKLITPLRQSIQELNTCMENLPHSVHSAVCFGMREAFGEQLDQIFNVNSNLATEAQSAIRQLQIITNSLCESGENFLEVADAFRECDFPSALKQSADHLQTSGEKLFYSSELLCNRISNLRDNLISSQAEWKLLAQTAAQELQSTKIILQQVEKLIPQLQSGAMSLQGSASLMTDASKQLRLTRLEVMKERRLAIETVQSLQTRLNADATLTNTCNTFALALESSLSSWNRNVERLDLLSQTTIEALIHSIHEDDEHLTKRAEAAGMALDTLRHQLNHELASAVERQRAAIAALAEPAHSSLELAKELEICLDNLQNRLIAVAAGSTPFNTHYDFEDNIDFNDIKSTNS